ncbi:MAG: hypothetical protein KDJ45_11200 [Hyphomicrobiaceae bacterium]|nr:hypothetical protein [Hyphomicrobiaceae bacterium]MCC0011448.1 hypothetical protein [Hyphomicrobiaceae bacterium]
MRANLIATMSLGLALVAAVLPTQTNADEGGQRIDLESLSGWWSGTGYIGFHGGQRETVQCRATYRQGEEAGSSTQSVRCATASGRVEIESHIIPDGEEIRGTWRERKYNVAGDLEGKFVPRGFRVVVKGEDISANMTVLLHKQQQVVEVQFFNSKLIGMTLILKRGSSQRS